MTDSSKDERTETSPEIQFPNIERMAVPVLDGNALPEEAVSLAEGIVPQDVMDWLRGERPDPPQDIRKMGEDVQAKLSWMVAYILLLQYSRIPLLQGYINRAEQVLFTGEDFSLPEGLEGFTPDMLAMIAGKHKLAVGQHKTVLEFTRKFASMNAEALKSSATEEEKLLLDKMRNLSPNQRDKLIKFLEQV